MRFYLNSFMKTLAFCLGLLAFAEAVNAGHANEEFHEHLHLRPLDDGRVSARFSFTTILKDIAPRAPSSLRGDDTPQHYTLFPLALGQVLREHAVTELHLTLNAGKWDYARWGYPEDPAVATGAELWAWMGESPSVSVDERWKALRNSLAGLFCASLGSLDKLRTTSPTYSFRPEGSLPLFNQSHQLRHASLPSENVCTENLTPFVKLLPCKTSTGIASLLNPHRLFDADWHGMGVHVQWSPQNGISVQLSFQAVLDPVRYSSQRQRDFSLKTLFDRQISKACPVATDSVVDVVMAESEYNVVSPGPSFMEGDLAKFMVPEFQIPLNISVRWPGESSFPYAAKRNSHPTNIEVVRTLTGPTQSYGKLSVQVKNNLETDVSVIYLETMPWLVQFYIHTLKLTVNGIGRPDLLKRFSYIPSEARGRPMLFEGVLTVPAQSTLQLTLDVVKSFLRYTEHQPDAERGWDLPPAVFIPVSNNSLERGSPRRIYTPAVLVDLATPDFSMPYNVIIMSSTLIALIFGSVFNLLTRRFVALPVEGPSEHSKSSKSTE